MKLTKAVISGMIILLAGCQAAKPAKNTAEKYPPLPYDNAGFIFVTPYALRSFVNYVAVLDANHNLYYWGNYSINGEHVFFVHYDHIEEDTDSKGKWGRMKGKGYRAFFNTIKQPPVFMVFCWESFIDKKMYETRIEFPDQMQQIMRTPILEPEGRRITGEPDWYHTLLIGLAPGGVVRLWLKYPGPRDNLVIEPKEISTVSGDQLDTCELIDTNNRPESEKTKQYIKGKKWPYGVW